MAWPTTDEPRDVFVTLRLTRKEAKALDTYARARKMSRSATVREAVGSVVLAARAKQKQQRSTP